VNKAKSDAGHGFAGPKNRIDFNAQTGGAPMSVDPEVCIRGG
jgi:hypothetical protein